MAPFSMRCACVRERGSARERGTGVRLTQFLDRTCGEYIYKGKKFNARKETVDGEDYYGIKVSPRAQSESELGSGELTRVRPFRSSASTSSAPNARPKSRSRPIQSVYSPYQIRLRALLTLHSLRNTDYVAEHGAARNFEPWRDTANDPEEDKLARMEEEENNPMAALENKAVDSKREMDILDALQELKTRNARLERAGKEAPEKFLDRVSAGVEVGDRELTKKLTEFEAERKRQEQEDEDEVRKVFGRAFMDGVPDIELDDGGASSSEDGSEPTTPRDGDDDSAPVASGSGASAKAKEASVKRKLDAIEPTPASLLSASSKAIYSKSMGPPPPKKKGKSNALALKLGIKLAPKKA